ncbi:sodium:solute symporter family transporter [Bacillus pacificus]
MENSFGNELPRWIIHCSWRCCCYTLFGGFLAVSWTDFVQGIIMVIALILVPTVTIMNVNGLGPAFSTIKSIDPTLLDIFKGTSVLGIISLFA